MGPARRPDSLFWVDPARIEGEHVTLDAEESRHLLRVFRAEPGTRFFATDGVGRRYLCQVVGVQRGEARAAIREIEGGGGELPSPIHLVVGMPDFHAAETIVEHAVPLGASSIVFAVCRRSGRDSLSDARLDRLQRIALAGLKQSFRSWLPLVASVPSLGSALDGVPMGTRLLADTAGRSALRDSAEPLQRPITLAVGPPGGFDAGEIDDLRMARFALISLGPNRLTTETASIAFLALARNSLLF